MPVSSVNSLADLGEAVIALVAVDPEREFALLERGKIAGTGDGRRGERECNESLHSQIPPSGLSCFDGPGC
jgi:hypothetical protein